MTGHQTAPPERVTPVTGAPLTPCRCPEAALLRQVLAGEIPAVDSPTWAALLALVEAAALYRVRNATDGPALVAMTRAGLGVPFTELERRRAVPGCPVRCPHCPSVRTVWPPPARTELACPQCRPRHPAPPAWPEPTTRTEAA